MSSSTDILNLKIGLWGSREAGKTTYLAMLNYIALESGWEIQSADLESEEFLGRMDRRIFRDHLFPPPTVGEQNIYKYHIAPPNQGVFGFLKNRRKYTLALLDVGGEAFETPERYRQEMQRQEGVDVYQYLSECAGIIFLLDPCRPEPRPKSDDLSYFEILSRAFFELRQQIDPRRPVRIPSAVAFCLAKMDEPEHRPYRNRPREHAADIVGRFAMRTIENNCVPRRYEFFACSAIGTVKDDMGNESPNYIPADDGTLQIADTENTRPFGLLEPLEWIFKQID